MCWGEGGVRRFMFLPDIGASGYFVVREAKMQIADLSLPSVVETALESAWTSSLMPQTQAMISRA
jgi:hypothetical protein